MNRVSRRVTAAIAVITLAVGVPGLAHAAPGTTQAQRPTGLISSAPPGSPGNPLPDGWEITGTGAEKQLVWTSTEPVPVGNARIEFHAGNRFLGSPVPTKDQRSFRLDLGGIRIGASEELKVLAAGRRLDAAAAPEGADARRSAAPTKPAAPLPANPVDPGVPGTYRTTSGEYALNSVRLPGYTNPIEMRATVVSPTDAPGRRPVALFLHGRHFTCYDAKGEISMSWPCETGFKAVPSYRGYLHDQKLLASQGYVTVSISANGINAQDAMVEDAGAQARSSLVRLHLARWAEWGAAPAKAPAAVRAGAPADLNRVLLVGHSRGGEGVNRAALDSRYKPPAAEDGYRGPARWRIRGTVLIGPTVFGHNPAPDVPSMTILPGCDGDVSDLQGQIYADGTRGTGRGASLHSSVYVIGANHNYFNTEWTPGQAEAPADDDFYPPEPGEKPDAVCALGTSAHRLTPTQQQKSGSTYIAAAARLFVGGDDRVRPLLDGSNLRAPSADPARVLTHAVGGNRTPFVVPDSSIAVTGGRLCNQVDHRAKTACLSPNESGSSPHFAEFVVSPEPGRQSVALNWSKAGTPVRMTPARPVSVAGAESLALRLIVPPNTTGTKVDVTVTDTAGRKATLGRATVDGLPGTNRTSAHWGREVRVPLTAAVKAGLNLKQLKTLELTPRTTSGRAWLVDAWGWRPGTPAVAPLELPRVDIGMLRVKEGNSGERTYQIPAKVTGKGSGQIRLFIRDLATDKLTSKTVTVTAGTHSINVPIKVKGNTRYGYDIWNMLAVKAVRGAAIGSYFGGVTVLDDDPMPKITVTPVAPRVTEGGVLKWRVSASAVADADVVTGFSIQPVTSGPALSTLDVDPAWIDRQFGGSATPERPLAKVADDPWLGAIILPGKKTAEVTVPTITDTVSEADETTRLRFFQYDRNWNPVPGAYYTGTVKNAS
ncbi:hypothetical protein ABZ348_06180 [Streptomyces sp. NPDC005963]|uniref:hypothetical protein n=1 Tax=Streptomyces sp. NPDC005963 TaxID=3156721 RepID=UPI0033CC3A1F